MYAKHEWDDGTDQTLYVLEALINFSPVNVNGHPLYEAAFLERAGHIALDIGLSDRKFGSGVELDGPFYGVYLVYMSPDNPLVIRGNLIHIDCEFDTPVYGKWTKDGIGAGLGLFLRDSLLIGFDYLWTDSEIGIPKQKSNENFYILSGKWVNKVQNNKAINIEGSIEIKEFDDSVEDETNTIISIKGDYYLNSRISIGGEMALNKGDNKSEEGNTFAIRLISFLNPRFYIRVDFEKLFAENATVNDEKEIYTNIGMRF